MKETTKMVNPSKRARAWLAASATLLAAAGGVAACVIPSPAGAGQSHKVISSAPAKAPVKRAYADTVRSVDSMHCLGGPWNQCY